MKIRLKKCHNHKIQIQTYLVILIEQIQIPFIRIYKTNLIFPKIFIQNKRKEIYLLERN